jgi:Zinc dependent phospholipase C
MAAPYAHCLVSREALKNLYDDTDFKRYQNITNPDETTLFFPYVCVGSVSPDFPYPAMHMGVNSEPDPKDKWTWGDKFHKLNTGNFVNIGVQELRQITDKTSEAFYKKAAWLMGYYSHVITDLVVHAVVYKLVGGCYENHSQPHLHCEVVQDSLLFHDVYSNPPQEFIDVGLLKIILEKCRVTGPPIDIPTYLPTFVFDPDIEKFWDFILRKNYPDFYNAEKPEIDKWYEKYKMLVGIDSTKVVARIAEPDMAYHRTDDIPPDEKAKYYTNMTLPDGMTGRYKEKVFDKAVADVTKGLKVFLNALDTGSYDAFKADLGDWNLDKGIMGDRNPKLALWDGEIHDLYKCKGDPPSTG